MSSVVPRVGPVVAALRPPGEWECGLQLTNDPRAPRIARVTVRTAMLGYGLAQSVAETAELLTGELVGNAVQHAESAVYVRARAREGMLRVSVWDNHPELPEPLPLSTSDAFGRGLFLVQYLSRAWGRYSLGPTTHCGTAEGKVVWFELAT